MCDGYTTEAKLCRRSATPFFRRRISLILMISLQTSVEDGSSIDFGKASRNRKGPVVYQLFSVIHGWLDSLKLSISSGTGCLIISPRKSRHSLNSYTHLTAGSFFWGLSGYPSGYPRSIGPNIVSSSLMPRVLFTSSSSVTMDPKPTQQLPIPMA